MSSPKKKLEEAVEKYAKVIETMKKVREELEKKK